MDYISVSLLMASDVSVPQSGWVATLGGAGDDIGNSIAIDGSGNLYVTGSTDSVGAGRLDLLVAKFSGEGTPLWQRTLGSSTDNLGNGIAIDGSGNIYVTGYTTSASGGTKNLLIAKYDTNGTLLWQRSLSGSGDEVGNSIAVDGSGNIYVTGYTTSASGGTQNLLIAKCDANGTLLWQRSLSGSTREVGNSIAVDGADNVYVTGYMFTTTEEENVLTVKYNTNGTLLWQRYMRNYTTTDDPDKGMGIAVDGSGNVYIGAQTGVAFIGSSVEFLIIKYDTNGTLQWRKTLDKSDYCHAIAVDGSGNSYAVGREFGGTTTWCVIMKYDTNGTSLWKRRFGGTNSDGAFGVAVDDSGYYYICGFTYSGGGALEDLLIAKLPDDGTPIGTYGAFPYTEVTYSGGSSTSFGTSTLTSSSFSLTSSTSSLTESTPSLISTFLAI